MDKFSQYAKSALVGAIIVVLAIVGVKIVPEKSIKLGTVETISDRTYLDAFGTASSSATLTSTYATSTSLRVQGLSNVVLAGTYTPKSYGSTLFLVIERSIDYGKNFYPYQVITPSTDRVSVWSNGFVTSSRGVPFMIPGSGSAASGTAMTFSFDTTLAADYIRILAKESTTSTAGTFNVQLLNTNH